MHANNVLCQFMELVDNSERQKKKELISSGVKWEYASGLLLCICINVRLCGRIREVKNILD